MCVDVTRWTYEAIARYMEWYPIDSFQGRYGSNFEIGYRYEGYLNPTSTATGRLGPR
ncbi:hypothetical protein GcM1_022002 [Golovinomyces cichoracearum]|uniref:Uncharacterized protein n=1 Tax=Golovinomyces cichoracearum TaxID=62708 RepID=A0A420JCQ1_9PEZI|nr:hypothetical protein GcM1_022002 [Golovinomyces cichoracearum]